MLDKYRARPTRARLAAWALLQAAYAALVRGFGRALDLGAALGVWAELLERHPRPGRASFQAAVDAAAGHPKGLKPACEIMARMRTEG